MIRSAAWRRGLFLHIPVILVLCPAFPFYWMNHHAVLPDGELYRPWNARNYMQSEPTSDARGTSSKPVRRDHSARWMLNTMFIALVLAGGSRFLRARGCGLYARGGGGGGGGGAGWYFFFCFFFLFFFGCFFWFFSLLFFFVFCIFLLFF